MQERLATGWPTDMFFGTSMPVRGQMMRSSCLFPPLLRNVPLTTALVGPCVRKGAVALEVKVAEAAAEEELAAILVVGALPGLVVEVGPPNSTSLTNFFVQCFFVTGSPT